MRPSGKSWCFEAFSNEPTADPFLYWWFSRGPRRIARILRGAVLIVRCDATGIELIILIRHIGRNNYLDSIIIALEK